MDRSRRLIDWLLRRIVGRSSRPQMALRFWQVPNETRTEGDDGETLVWGDYPPLRET